MLLTALSTAFLGVQAMEKSFQQLTLVDLRQNMQKIKAMRSVLHELEKKHVLNRHEISRFNDGQDDLLLEDLYVHLSKQSRLQLRMISPGALHLLSLEELKQIAAKIRLFLNRDATVEIYENDDELVSDGDDMQFVFEDSSQWKSKGSEDLLPIIGSGNKENKMDSSSIFKDSIIKESIFNDVKTSDKEIIFKEKKSPRIVMYTYDVKKPLYDEKPILIQSDMHIQSVLPQNFKHEPICVLSSPTGAFNNDESLDLLCGENNDDLKQLKTVLEWIRTKSSSFRRACDYILANKLRAFFYELNDTECYGPVKLLWLWHTNGSTNRNIKNVTVEAAKKFGDLVAAFYENNKK